MPSSTNARSSCDGRMPSPLSSRCGNNDSKPTSALCLGGYGLQPVHFSADKKDGALAPEVNPSQITAILLASRSWRYESLATCRPKCSLRNSLQLWINAHLLHPPAALLPRAAAPQSRPRCPPLQIESARLHKSGS